MRSQPLNPGLQSPADWPKPQHDLSQLDFKKVELGRQLFYDPQLSRDGSISCAHCHLVYTGFTHIDHDLSHGIENRIGTRNTLAIINPAWQEHYMWDGGVRHLNLQSLAPLTSHFEMDQDLDTLLSYLQQDSSYQAEYLQAFGEVSIPNTLQALSDFMLTFISNNSKYDKMKRGDSTALFTESENRGYQIFQQKCNTCHQEPLFSHPGFKSNGLTQDSTLMDLGRFSITQNPQDSFLFRVPTLRNIEVTYPYMHDGRFKNLQMVLHHYNHEIHPETSPYLSQELREPLNLSDSDKRDVIRFLKTLTDREFLYNPKLAFPNKN